MNLAGLGIDTMESTFDDPDFSALFLPSPTLPPLLLLIAFLATQKSCTSLHDFSSSYIINEMSN